MDEGEIRMKNVYITYGCPFPALGTAGARGSRGCVSLERHNQSLPLSELGPVLTRCRDPIVHWELCYCVLPMCNQMGRSEDFCVPSE